MRLVHHAHPKTETFMHLEENKKQLPKIKTKDRCTSNRYVPGKILSNLKPSLVRLVSLFAAVSIPNDPTGANITFTMEEHVPLHFTSPEILTCAYHKQATGKS
jgi:hypothetical protein